MAKLFDSKAAFTKHFKIKDRLDKSRCELKDNLEALYGRKVAFFEEKNFPSGRKGVSIFFWVTEGEEVEKKDVYYSTINEMGKKYLVDKLQK